MKVKFKASDRYPTFTGTHFWRDGDVKDVSGSEAERLVGDWPHMFSLVTDEPAGDKKAKKPASNKMMKPDADK